MPSKFDPDITISYKEVRIHNHLIDDDGSFH